METSTKPAPGRLMPPHNLARIERRRTLAHVLLDLKEARRDWVDALEADDADADDRATEADRRVDQLRDEFATGFHLATGLTWRQVEEAVAEAVL